MRPSGRAGKAAAGIAAVIGDGGLAAGAEAAGSGSGAAPAVAAPSPLPAAGAGYLDVVPQVLPSVVLIPQRGRPGLGDSSRARAGDVMLAVGNPLGLSGSVTEGIISATGRAVTEPAMPGSPGTVLPDAIQTSAPINPGNSGGALVNMAGQVIGIPTLAAASSQNGEQAQGIGFAIPANLARDIAAQLLKSGRVSRTGRAAIGAQVYTLTEADGSPGGGALAAVTRGPAYRAGLRTGDVLILVAGTPPPDVTELVEPLAARQPSRTITVQAAPGILELAPSASFLVAEPPSWPRQGPPTCPAPGRREA